MEKPVKIKVVSKVSAVSSATPFEYRPGYLFTEDASCNDYDWLVVHDEIPERDAGTFRDGSELLACPRSNTILATWEPTSIKCYTRAYAAQFGHLLSNRPPEAEKHPRYHLGRGYYRPLVGRPYPEWASSPKCEKTDAVTAICSSKAMRWTKHHARIRLLERFVAETPGAEWYGHGVKEFARKCDAMDSCRYHVALENHIAPHYWSEKITDAFLCECLPFYAGAPDLADDFPAESFIPIPIDDPEEAVAIINAAVESGEYMKRREAILEAKRLVIEKYNFWAQVIAVIEGAKAAGEADIPDASPQRIWARKAVRRKNPFAALEAGFFHFRQYMPKRAEKGFSR